MIYNIIKEETIKKCDKCDIDFEVPEEFNDHLKQCLDEPKNFKCKFCDTCWVSHLSLWQHIAVDHKMIQFVCEVCGSVRTSKNDLKVHQNMFMTKHMILCVISVQNQKLTKQD